ncbi:hypothetical protein HY373_00730 [Candidatus Berkelbacteria bacterium]|nr:hypothetical protein [Candidatus Berkelbacteria bacterium]MBI4029689.1 hypothetical protein [Candidatus Berkelbacteria bacterium]
MVEILGAQSEFGQETEELEFNLENIRKIFNSSMREVDEEAIESQSGVWKQSAVLIEKQNGINETENFTPTEKIALSLLIDARRAVLREVKRGVLWRRHNEHNPVENENKILEDLKLSDAVWQGRLSQFLWENLDRPWVERFAENYWGTLEHYNDLYHSKIELPSILRNGVLGEVCFASLVQKMNLGLRPHWPSPRQDVEDKIDLFLILPGRVLVCQIKTVNYISQPSAENLSAEEADGETDRDKLVQAARRLESKDPHQRKFIPMWIDMSTGGIEEGVNLLTGKPKEWYTREALESRKFGQILKASMEGEKQRL